MQSWSAIAAKQCNPSSDVKKCKLNIQYNVENKSKAIELDNIPRHKEIEAHPADDFEMTNGYNDYYENSPTPIPQYNDYDGFKYPKYNPTPQEIERGKYASKYKEFMWRDPENYKNPPYPLGKIGSMAICNDSDNTILLSGGHVDGYRLKNGRKIYSHVIQYNVRTKKYKKHSTMLEPNCGHKMFKIKSYIYIIGGKLKKNEIHIFKPGQKKTERKWICHKLNHTFGKRDRFWSDKMFYKVKDNLIHVFDTATLGHWTIDVLNEFRINKLKQYQLPSKELIECISSIFYYKNQWNVIGRRKRYAFDTWGIWYFDEKEWIQRKVRFETVSKHREWSRFECILYDGYLIIGNIVGPQGYATYTSGIIDIDNDIFIETRSPMVGLPLSALILKKNYNQIYIFGGDETDSCGMFVRKDQMVIILREIKKDKITLVDGYVVSKCLENERNMIIPKNVIDLIAKYLVLSFI